MGGLLAAVVLAGCTYAEREPGLFGRPGPETDEVSELPAPRPTRPTLPPSNPGLPVVGEDVWTSAEGLDLEVRIAVHAVRRLETATVLDWSITPLRAPNLNIGDLVPRSIDLGLSRRSRSAPDIAIVDAGQTRLYRPLLTADGPDRCLCTPMWLVQRQLRIGVTSLLQTAFPALPAGTRSVDVAVATVPQFGRVPLTAVGQLPVADRAVDLTRPDGIDTLESVSPMFRHGADEQVFRLQVRRVLAGATFTSLEWAIVSVTGGRGVDDASQPPFADPDTAVVVANPVTASGPVLRLADGDIRRSRLVTGGVGTRECLCSDLRGWAKLLQRPDKVATVVTNYPALPPGTPRVRVEFAGLESMPAYVTAAADPRQTAEPRVAPPSWWPDTSAPRAPWRSEDWPTPVPPADALSGFGGKAERLLR